MVNADIVEKTKESTPESTRKIPATFERNETVRIEAFSDGIFAIAITLLVLGINVPKVRELGAGASLGSTLIKQWPHYLAFVTSFITIFAKWVNHHRIFSFIQRTDHPFLYWNGLLLLFITFMPFPTSLLAEYLLHPEAKAAGAVFAGTYAAIAFAFKGLWHHASKNGRLLAQNVDDREIRQITMQYRYGPLLYLMAFVLSFVSVGLSVGLCLCLAVFFAVKGWPTLRSAAQLFPKFPRKRKSEITRS
jgi:uncharacterized membrane protein